VNRGTTTAGEPTISATGCCCYIHDVYIHLRGGASWLYNLFIGFVERPVRKNLQEKTFCETAKTAIDIPLPMKMPLSLRKEWLLDYRLISSPTLKSGYMESFHKGEFFSAADSSEIPFQLLPLPSPPTVDRMATFYI